MVLVGLPIGTFISLSFAAPLIKRFSPARTLMFVLSAWSLIFLLPAGANSALVLAIALGCCGLIVGVLEIASNVEADSIERQFNKRIMSRCHGFWSLGAMSGALLGGPVFGDRGVSVFDQFLVLSPIAVIASVLVTRLLASSRVLSTVPKHDQACNARRAPISRHVFLLCLIPIGVMAVEGAFMDWSAVFMQEQMKTGSAVAGYTFAMFAGVMAAVRLSGDWLGERFGDALVVRASGTTAAVGVILFATASSVSVAFIGAAMAGAGAAIVYPLTMTAVAGVNETHREDNVAYLSIAAFSVFMIAPPVIGGVAEFSSLRYGLLILVPGAVVTALLASRLTTR